MQDILIVSVRYAEVNETRDGQNDSIQNSSIPNVATLPVILDDDLAIIGVSGPATLRLVAAGRFDVAESLVVRSRSRWVLSHRYWVGVWHADGDELLALDVDLALAALTVAMASVCGAARFGAAAR